MRFGSLCSGIEAASVAFESIGWGAAWFAEIDNFPSAVLTHHYPNVPNHGDMWTIRDRILSGEIEAPDVLVGGPPCQSFSIAGNRESLNDSRGNLTLEYINICNANDSVRRAAGKRECWILYENVPGLLNTNDNAFGAFLAGLAGEDVALEPGPRPEQGRSSAHWTWKGRLGKHVPKWPVAGVVDGPHRTVAWRVLDAQHFGLAQRRKRVFVLARGGAGRWAAADALLPIIESGRWHPAPSRPSRQGVAPTISARTSGGGGLGTDFDLDGGLQAIAIQERAVSENPDAGPQGKGWQNDVGFTLEARHHSQFVAAPIVMAHGQANAEVVSDGSPSLTCNHEAPIVFDPAQVTSVTNRSNPQPGDPCHTLHQSDPPMLIRMREGKDGGGKGPLVSEDQSLTLATGNDQVLCASAPNNTFEHKGIKHARPQEAYSGEILRTLREEIGEEAFVQWGFGIIASLQQEEVLRAWLHGDGLRREATARRDTSKLIKAPFKEGCSGWPMRELWEHGPDGRTPQGRRLVEQLCDELEAAVPQLSHAGTLTEEAMHGMRKAAEGIGVLRQALSAVQEVGQPEQDGIFRKEDMLGSRVQHEEPRPRNVQQACAAEEEGNTRSATENEVGVCDGKVGQRLVVRRLVPEETEALQGFPRGYTAIPWRGKPADQCPDGPRYKALGNSWAVPCARYIGERIQAVMP